MAAKKPRKKLALETLPGMTLYGTDKEGVRLLEFRDDLVSADGKKKTRIKDKRDGACALAALLGGYLQKYNVPNYVLGTCDRHSLRVGATGPYGFAVTVRNLASKALASRLGLDAGTELACPVIEYRYLSDKLKNPLVNEYHAMALGLADRTSLDRVNELALKANAVLKAYLGRRGLNLIDFEMRPGTLDGGTVLASPVCLDFCSVADIDGGFTFDRSAFGNDTRKIRAAYQAAAAKLEA